MVHCCTTSHSHGKWSLEVMEKSWNFYGKCVGVHWKYTIFRSAFLLMWRLVQMELERQHFSRSSLENCVQSMVSIMHIAASESVTLVSIMSTSLTWTSALLKSLRLNFPVCIWVSMYSRFHSTVSPFLPFFSCLLEWDVVITFCQIIIIA